MPRNSSTIIPSSPVIPSLSTSSPSTTSSPQPTPAAAQQTSNSKTLFGGRYIPGGTSVKTAITKESLNNLNETMRKAIDGKFKSTSLIGSAQSVDGSLFSDSFAEYIKIATSLAAIIAFAMILYGGFLYLTAGVNEENKEKGLKIVKFTITGVVVLAISYTLTATIINMLSGQGAWVK